MSNVDNSFTNAYFLTQFIMFMILVFVIIIENVTVIFVILTQGFLTITKIFILAMSTCNILAGPLLISLEMYNALKSQTFNTVECQAILMFEVTCFTANIYTIVVFVVNVYGTIVAKGSYTLSTRKTALLVVTLVWVCSMGYASKSLLSILKIETAFTHDGSVSTLVPTLVINKNKSLENKTENDTRPPALDDQLCGYVFEHSEYNLLTTAFDVTVMLLIPHVVCVYCFVKLRQQLWDPNNGMNRALDQRRRLFKLLVGLAIGSITSWVPSMLFDIVVDCLSLQMEPNLSHQFERSTLFVSVKVVCAFLAFLPATVNPILFACLSDSFMHDLRKNCCCCPNDVRVCPENVKLSDQDKEEREITPYLSHENGETPC